jgi:16S rRNA (guanine(966)-N(2))-methyltransferase RsmD
LFNVLGPPPENAWVLDLFAGAGALGLEALSRGALRAVFVDSSRRAKSYLDKNVRELGLGDRSEIHVGDALRAIGKLEARDLRFSWVFVDPPYASDLGPRALERLAQSQLLAADVVVAYEHDKRQTPADTIGALTRTFFRTYGDTSLSLYRTMMSPHAA